MGGVAKRGIGVPGSPNPNVPRFIDSDSVQPIDFAALRQKHRELLAELAKVAAIIDHTNTGQELHDQALLATQQDLAETNAAVTDYMMTTSPDASSAVFPHREAV